MDFTKDSLMSHLPVPIRCRQMPLRQDSAAGGDTGSHIIWSSDVQTL